MKITLERAMEAWLATNGQWGKMLVYLSQRPGIHRTDWYRIKNDGTRRYVCNVCDGLIVQTPSGRRVPSPTKALATHAQLHLDQLEAHLNMRR